MDVMKWLGRIGRRTPRLSVSFLAGMSVFVFPADAEGQTRTPAEFPYIAPARALELVLALDSRGLQAIHGAFIESGTRLAGVELPGNHHGYTNDERQRLLDGLERIARSGPWPRGRFDPGDEAMLVFFHLAVDSTYTVSGPEIRQRLIGLYRSDAPPRIRSRAVFSLAEIVAISDTPEPELLQLFADLAASPPDPNGPLPMTGIRALLNTCEKGIPVLRGLQEEARAGTPDVEVALATLARRGFPLERVSQTGPACHEGWDDYFARVPTLPSLPDPLYVRSSVFKQALWEFVIEPPADAEVREPASVADPEALLAALRAGVDDEAIYLAFAEARLTYRGFQPGNRHLYTDPQRERLLDGIIEIAALGAIEEPRSASGLALRLLQRLTAFPDLVRPDTRMGERLLRLYRETPDLRVRSRTVQLLAEHVALSEVPQPEILDLFFSIAASRTGTDGISQYMGVTALLDSCEMGIDHVRELHRHFQDLIRRETEAGIRKWTVEGYATEIEREIEAVARGRFVPRKRSIGPACGQSWDEYLGMGGRAN